MVKEIFYFEIWVDRYLDYLYNYIIVRVNDYEVV